MNTSSCPPNSPSIKAFLPLIEVTERLGYTLQTLQHGDRKGQVRSDLASGSDEQLSGQFSGDSAFSPLAVNMCKPIEQSLAVQNNTEDCVGSNHAKAKDTSLVEEQSGAGLPRVIDQPTEQSMPLENGAAEASVLTEPRLSQETGITSKDVSLVQKPADLEIGLPDCEIEFDCGGVDNNNMLELREKESARQNASTTVSRCVRCLYH